jgi:hypothetical protein
MADGTGESSAMVAMPASILRRLPVEPLGDLAIVAAAAKRGYSLGLLLPMPCCEGAFRFRSSLSIMDWTRRIAKSFSFVTVFPVRTSPPIENRQTQTSSRRDAGSTLNSISLRRIHSRRRAK